MYSSVDGPRFSANTVHLAMCLRSGRLGPLITETCVTGAGGLAVIEDCCIVSWINAVVCKVSLAPLGRGRVSAEEDGKE